MPISLLIQLFVLTCIVSILPTNAAARCNMVEVEFYLENGFSQEQITRICENASTNDQQCESLQPERDLTPHQIEQLCSTYVETNFDCGSCSKQSIENRSKDNQEDLSLNKVAIAERTSQSQKEYDAIQLLKTGGDVFNLKVTDSDLIYTDKNCLLSGSATERGRRREYCHDVHYKISRHNLQASIGKALPIVGDPIATLVGDISIELASGLSEYPFEIRKKFEAYLHGIKEKDNAEFPVRKGIAVETLVHALQILSL